MMMDGVRPCFALFGDSITQQSWADGGWGALLAADYANSMDVFNRGFGGYNTRWSSIIAKHCINSKAMPQLEMVFIFFGANDAVLPGLRDDFSRQFVPVDEYERNLKEMGVAVLGMTNRDGSAPRVTIIGPPPVDDDRWLAEMRHKYLQPGQDAATIQCNRLLENVKLYNAAARSAAAFLKSPFVDLCAAILAEGDGWRQCLSDGLHLSAAGSKVLHRLLRAELDAVPRGQFKLEAMPAQVSADASSGVAWSLFAP
jgi:lysophospholipase L1-like esterase